MTIAVGVDGCAKGWVFVAARDGAFLTAELHVRFVDGLERWAEAAAIAVDIPIGLPERGVRRADQEARALLRGRASTVFNAPVHAVLKADGYPAANALSRELSERGLSRQSYALVPKIAEVEAARSPTIFEAHPEVSFAAIAGGPVPASKHTWQGMAERRRLLSSIGIEIPDDLGSAGVAAPDDVLDAAVAAWTAHRKALGQAVPLPNPPELIAGYQAAIWY